MPFVYLFLRIFAVFFLAPVFWAFAFNQRLRFLVVFLIFKSIAFKAMQKNTDFHYSGA